MDSQTIRTALGLLQENPDDEQGWRSLKEGAAVAEGDLPLAEFGRLLEAARQQHRSSGEWDAVAGLLRVELEAAQGTDREPGLWAEYARVLHDELLEGARSAESYQKLVELKPADTSAKHALSEYQGKLSRWKDLESSYLAEAENATDDVYQSSMLMRASEVALRFGGQEADQRAVIDRLERAVRLDTSNERAAKMLDRVYRREGKWEDAARVLERLADRAETPAARVQAGVRLARLYHRQLGDRERAVRAYTRVLRDDPTHPEAMDFLSALFSREQRWEELVGLYEKQLRNADLGNLERLGDMLQIAMLYWRKLGRPQDAESWFERIRKLEPAHPGMLDFYREYLGQLGDDARLISVLAAAQRAAKNDQDRTRLGTELARLAEGQRNAQKAIEQYKSLLRHDPDNRDAREALMRLYRQTEGYNALVELLRQQLERTDPKDLEARIAILRQVAEVYRTFIKSDTALVSVLNQIVQLDEQIDERDVDELRELVILYHKLGRWRDLLTYQLKLAEVSPDVEEKKRLYHAAGQRWLEQFTNVQNATEAYEQLLKVAPDDNEARQKLEDLYRKRRAWPSLYDLFASEVDRVEGDRRIATLKEMAQLAAERLNRGADAIRLYRQILSEDPSRSEVLDALEKHAERARDWSTLAEALERRVTLLADDQERLNVLQKLGAVYGEHLEDPVRAASAWRRVLELQPGHHRALRVLRDAYLQSGDYEGLEQLYASQNDFEGLADVLSNAADRARDPAGKIELSYRAARVYEEQLGQPDRSFRSYERILATDPTDARAAAALIPLYEQDEKWARLPALYEVMLQRNEDPREKFLLLERMVEVTGSRLADRRAAVAYARKAYELDPTEPGALELLENAARAAPAWESFVEAVEHRLGQLGPTAAAEPTADEGAKKKRKKKRGKEEEAAETGADTAPKAEEEERRTLELKLGRIYVEELGRVDEAAAAYRRLLERNPGDEDASGALETILRREDRREELRWLLDLRVSYAPSNEERVRILGEWATLEEEVFESREQASLLYRRVLELAPADEVALRALPRLLLSAGDAQGAAEVIARDRDRLAGAERAEREVELAELSLDRLDRPADALGAAVRALELVPYETRAVRVLERLQRIPEMQARAAAVLAEQYAAHGDPRREAHSLGVLLEHATAKAERLALYGRLADVFEHKLESHSAALDVILRGASEYPLELDLWTRAEALAKRTGRPTDLAQTFREVLLRELPADIQIELSDRAARWHEERLGDPMGATPYLEKVLTLDPSNERAFVRLKDIFTAAERWGELEALYDRTSEATLDIGRRTTMLAEVALVCEDITEEPAKATRYYERILEIDPLHETALHALDRLYTAQKRHKDLARLLERRLETSVGDDVFEYKLRLGRIQLTELLEPDKAILHVEDVLRERPNDHSARELAEKMLEIGSLRARAARILEAVYEARDEIRDLVRVLGIRLDELDAELGERETVDSTRADEHRELLRRIAALRDERLHDDEGAFAALSRLVPEDPLDSAARDRMLEIARRLGVHARVADVLTRAANRADTPGVQGEILMRVARLYQDQLGDNDQAEATYRRVLGLDEHDAELVLPAARALERIYAATDRSAQLAEMLRVEVRLEQDSATRSDLLGRLGELCQKVLGDAQGAIQAWKARAEENPNDDVALSALDQLYEQTGSWRELVSVLERRRDVVEDPTLRRRLMTRAADVLAEKLGNTNAAIDAWRMVWDEFGPDAESLTALERLLRAAERWPELAETYERHLDFAQGNAQRLDLLAQLGDLRREHLGDVVRSLDAYNQALSLDSAHAPSRLALEKLLDAEDPLHRREAAEILHPIYQAEGNHERLLRVLEIEVDTSEDVDSRLEGLERAMQVAEQSLGDRSRAFGYAERGLREAVGHVDPQPWLRHTERLAESTERQADQVRLLCEIMPSLFDGELQLAVTLRIAELARHRLADRDLAREYYRKALDVRPDERTALVALESLYEEAGDAQALLEILERRVDVAETEEEKKQLLYRRARLLAEVLEDKPRAIQVYESILDLSLEDPAVTALEHLYTDQQQWNDLIGLYERELTHKRGDPARIHVKIATLAARRQLDVDRAFEELERALELNRQHEDAIRELERLLREAEDPEHRARAAVLLEPVYLGRADYDRVMQTLRARLDASHDPEERRQLLGRLAHLYEEQKEDYLQALETTALLLHEDPGNPETIGELERLAKVANASQRLAEIYASELTDDLVMDESTARLARRTGQLFDQLGGLDRALTFLRRALAFEPENEELFREIDDILERTSRHQERVELYRQALDHRYAPAARLELLHTIARLERVPLAKPDEAIETYRAALDVDDRDLVALDALTELYRERERWTDLSELYLRRAETAESEDQAAAFRLALSRLYLAQLGDPERAIDQLEEIVRSLSAHTEAIHELESLLGRPEHKLRIVEILRPLYQAEDDWRHTIKLNEERFGLASELSEKVAVLRETSDLWERRGQDLPRAWKALRLAFELDPDDGDVRAELERLTSATAAYEQLASTYDAILKERPDLVSRREVLAKLAELYDRYLDDPRQALAAHARLHEADPTSLEPLEKMEQLAMLLGDWQTVVRALVARADLLLDDQERASLWRRVGEAKRDMLDDRPGAIDAYERALELDPPSEFTVDCLIELYEERRDAPRLVELYQRRVELSGDDDVDLRYDLLTRAARCYEEELSDRPRAIDSLGQALVVRPGDRAVLDSLNRLYRAEQMWPELLDNLKLQAGMAQSTQDRARLRKEVGNILAQQLRSYDEALEAYRLVLEEVPDDLEAASAVRGMAEEHLDLREAVAAILVPVLRGVGRWADLAGVLEMRLSVETEATERAQTLVSIAEVLEGKLDQPVEAQRALLRALAESPEDAKLHSEAERLAALSDGWGRYADSLAERAAAVFDPTVSKDLYSRLGRIAETRLGDDQRAIAAYARALEQAGDEPELLEALDRLYTKTHNAQALSEILERRALIATGDAEQAELSYRLALLHIRDFRDPARGLTALRATLERAPDHDAAAQELEKLTVERDLFEEAAEILETVYRARGKQTELAALYAKRVEFAETPGERIDRRHDWAVVLEQECSDPAAAQRVLEQGLGDDPTEPTQLAELERLAAITGEWAAAAGALEQALAARSDLGRDTARELWVRLAIWLRDQVRDTTRAEQALVQALGSEPSSDEVLQLLEQLQRRPGRERDLLTTLRQRSRLQLDDQQREELVRQAKQLAEQLGDAQLAEELLRELLLRDESNTWALAELTRLREAAGDYQETFDLLVRRADIHLEGELVRELRHRAALIARDRLGKHQEAIQLYEALFDDRPTDEVAAKALRGLYESTKQWQDLGRLLDRLIDLADTPAERASLRIELARLNEQQYRAFDTAIGLLHAVLEEQPGHGDAVVALSQLLEKTKRDEELAELLTSQIQAARARGDTEAELRFQVRLGEVYESRLKDRVRAIETYRGVLERQPRHREALQALARLHQEVGEHAEAAQALEVLLELSQGEDAVHYAGVLADEYGKLGDSDNAARALERGLAADGHNAVLRARLGALYNSQKAWDKLASLVAHDAELADLASDKVKLLREAAEIHASRRGDFAAAAGLLERATAFSPSDRELLLQLCDAYSASGRGKAAAEVLEKVVESFGGRRTKELADIHRRLADAYLAEGQSSRAMEELDKAFRIEPGNVHVLKKLGTVALEAGDAKKAQQMFRALLLQKLDEASPITKAEVFFYLGEVHGKLGEKDKAKQMFERAVQADAGLTRAKDRLAELKA